jgi:hypothetical protein
MRMSLRLFLQDPVHFLIDVFRRFNLGAGHPPALYQLE